MESAPHPTIADIGALLEAWAPTDTAQSYDNVGLQVGNPRQHVQRAVVALDLTHGVIDEAKARGAQLIVTHHPLIFKPLRSVRAGGGPSGLAFRLAAEGLALYSIHTNLDAAPAGVSFALAEQLGLEATRVLDPLPSHHVKLVTFVPADHLEAVRTALADAGAGRIGDYEACAFAQPGTGFFRPGEAANPFIGEAGGALERVDEVRLEALVQRWHLGAAVRALEASHPYEEVAYDVYPVEQADSRTGLGVLGRLPEPEALTAFLARVQQALGAGALRYAGDDEATIRTVAVCGGAGSDLIGKAMRAGADAYVTADVTYHRFFDVLGPEGTPRMALIDPGHYETEAVTEALLCRWLGHRLPEVAWLRTTQRTSPMKTHTSSL